MTAVTASGEESGLPWDSEVLWAGGLTGETFFVARVPSVDRLPGDFGVAGDVCTPDVVWSCVEVCIAVEATWKLSTMRSQHIMYGVSLY